MKDLGQDGKLGRNKLTQPHQLEPFSELSDIVKQVPVRGPVYEGSGAGWRAGEE